MIGISAIGSYIPHNSINNEERLSAFDVDKEFIEQKTGMLRLAIKERQQETSDLCVLSFRDLLQKSNLNPDEIDCIVVCTQNPDAYGLPHTSAIVHGKLGLPDCCAAFDISLGCSGYVYGLSIIHSFMQANSLKNGILFTADPYSKIVDQSDRNTALLFGDAATATLVSEAPIWSLGKCSFGTSGADHQAIHIDEASGRLSMNGRKVFSFSSVMVPEDIRNVLKINNVRLENIDRFILHQGSRFIVNSIAKRLGVAEERVPFLSAQYGNTVSSSIPLILQDMSNYKTVLLSGFGVGLSWASTVLFNLAYKRA